MKFIFVRFFFTPSSSLYFTERFSVRVANAKNFFTVIEIPVTRAMTPSIRRRCKHPSCEFADVWFYDFVFSSETILHRGADDDAKLSPTPARFIGG